MSTLSRDQILRLLDLLDAAAKRRGVRIDMFRVGDAAMALGYSTTRSTMEAVYPRQTLTPKVQYVIEGIAEIAGADSPD